MHSHSSQPRYTGAMPYMPGAMPMQLYPAQMGQGFCHSCCHPKSKCVCGCCECRKEAKELLVKSEFQYGALQKNPAYIGLTKMPYVAPVAAAVTPSMLYAEALRPGATREPAAEAALFGFGTAFIGGGCCVHLSAEYTPTTPTTASLIAVFVQDSESTVLAWVKVEKAGVGYQIKECIVTTKPGADLVVVTGNMTARIRWCEIFSCC